MASDRGVDISEWQGILEPDWFAQWRFGGVRVHSGYSPDRFHAENIRNVVDSGIPWFVYGFMVPDRDRRWQAEQALDLTLAAGRGLPPLGFWCDAETLSDETGGVRTYCDRWGELGLAKRGYYTNDWRVDHRQLVDLSYWYAGYAGTNDGAYHAPPDNLRRAPHLYQFTSTNGRLDQNVVVDEAWYYSIVGGGSFMPDLSEAEQREILNWIRGARDGAPEYGIGPLLVEASAAGEFAKLATNGVPDFGLEKLLPAVTETARKVRALSDDGNPNPAPDLGPLREKLTVAAQSMAALAHDLTDAIAAIP